VFRAGGVGDTSTALWWPASQLDVLGVDSSCTQHTAPVREGRAREPLLFCWAAHIPPTPYQPVSCPFTNPHLLYLLPLLPSHTPTHSP
jgi:hypothetical protein